MNGYYTYISRKQIGVIFSNWKKGNINISDEVISWLYKECAEVRGHNYNNNFENVLQTVKNAIELIFSGNNEEAAESINRAYRLYNIIYA